VVEHHEADTSTGESVNGKIESVISLEVSRKLTSSRHQEVSAVILISESVSADNDRLGPVVDQSRDVLDDDWFSKDGSVKVISDGSIGALPHLLEVELLDSGLIGSDGGTLDADLALLDGSSGVHSDGVVSLVSVLHAQIEVLDVEIEERMDQLVLDLLPEDTGHLITVELSNGVLDLEFLPSKTVSKASVGYVGYAPRYHLNN